MKKFVKYGIISGILLILAGAGMMTASFALGADTRRIERFIDDRVDMFEDHYEFPLENDYIELENDDMEPLEENTVRPAVEAGPSGEGFEAGYSDVSKLEIRQNGGNVEINVMDDIDEVTVKGANENLEKIHYGESDGESRLVLNADADESYQIFIPRAWVFHEFEADVRGGSLSGSEIQAQETELSAVGGSIRLSQQWTDTVDLECKGGDLQWSILENMDVHVDAECKGGAISLIFPGDLDLGSVGYEIECEAGAVSFPDFVVRGVEKRKEDASGEEGLPYLDLEVKGGAIKVLNQEAD